MKYFPFRRSSHSHQPHQEEYDAERIGSEAERMEEEQQGHTLAVGVTTATNDAYGRIRNNGHESHFKSFETLDIPWNNILHQSSSNAAAAAASRSNNLDYTAIQKSIRTHVVNQSSSTLVKDLIIRLPNDAIHNIAAFITPKELKNLTVTCKAFHKATRTVWKRVRMHGYYCAVNIITAFLRNELSDARELAGLYCRAGVSIYPRMWEHGWAYQTILWRMGCEVVNKHQQQESVEDLEEEDQSANGDQDVTVEAMRKKDQFFTDRFEARVQAEYFCLLSKFSYLEEKSLFWMYQPLLSEAQSSATNGRNSRVKLNEYNMKAAKIHIHKHLFDQHILNQVCVDDDIDDLRSEASLSADFFHPSRNYYTLNKAMRDLLDGSTNSTAMGPLQNLLDHVDDSENSRSESLSDKMTSILSNVQIEVYSAPIPFDGEQQRSTSSSSKGSAWTDNDNILFEAKENFRKFRTDLESLFDAGDENGFEECLADFWDTFFGATAGISYHNRHTAFPRVSKLDDFLTRPCPVAVGVIQCEIERIRKVDQSVKGRLFPTYEYRLYIRSRRDSTQKQDMNLMVAKSIGRHGSKRGMNNYMIHKAKETYVPTVADNEEDFEILPGVELGRLQSNFIGNEFQVYSRKEKKISHQEKKNDLPQSRPNSRLPSCNGYEWKSDSESDMDESNDNNTNLIRRIGSKVLFSHHYVPSWPKLISSRKGRKKIAVADPVACEDEEEMESCTEDLKSTSFEKEEGAITFTANLLGNRPRVMDVCIPKVETGDGDVPERRFEDTDMMSCFKILQERLNDLETSDNDNVETGVVEDTWDDFGLIALQNKQPWWNVELGAFVLNFGGRVSVASVKNFQLGARNDQDHVMLQFGRVQGRHSFTMDYQYPLTAFQAFAIAISSLQSKMSLA